MGEGLSVLVGKDYFSGPFKIQKGGDCMLDTIKAYIDIFIVFHVNAFYSIGYFLKNNFFFIFVLFAIMYLVYQELRVEAYNYVDDERRII